MNRFLPALAVLIVSIDVAWAAGCDPATSAALESLTSVRLVAHITELSSPSYHGRRAGSEGAAKAAAYLEKQFTEMKLAAKGSDGFAQPFTVGDRTLKNVAALLEGGDQRLAKEYVVIGAHYDHLGEKNGKMYPGADDNASGCAVLLEVARVLARGDERPRRGVLFLAFDGEESGLLGSKYFVAQPTVAKAKIAAMINLDMVSRGDAGHLQVCGTSCSKQLKALVEAAAPTAHLELRYDFEREWRNASDHGPFGDAEIPFLYFGVEDHEDYHQPTDTADKVNAAKIEKIARLTYLTVLAIADADDRPAFTKH